MMQRGPMQRKGKGYNNIMTSDSAVHNIISRHDMAIRLQREGVTRAYTMAPHSTAHLYFRGCAGVRVWVLE